MHRLRFQKLEYIPETVFTACTGDILLDHVKLVLLEREPEIVIPEITEHGRTVINSLRIRQRVQEHIFHHTFPAAGNRPHEHAVNGIILVLA